MSGYRQKAFKVRLHVISPIHIGCDDTYEPTGFVVDRNKKQLLAFDPIDFVQGLDGSERQKFLAICEKGTLGSLVELYKFMDGRQTEAVGRTVGVSDGFLANYDRVVKQLSATNERDIRQELNKFLIARTSFLPIDHAPYIPGTSLKGALRTGWLNHLQRGMPTKVDSKKARDFEKQLLDGDFAADPFRLVKISDLMPVDQPETMILFAVNKKKKPSKHEARGPQQILEVIRHDRDAVFEGIVTLVALESGAAITKPISVDSQFFQQATSFFQAEMAAEEAMLQGVNLPVGIEKKMLQRFGDRFLKAVFPVRLGRHSGAEAMTIKGIRSIKIMGKQGDQPKYGPSAITTWLAGDSSKATSGLQPFGWAALEILDVNPAALWPQRHITERQPTVRTVPPLSFTPSTPTITTETLIWETATLSWTPGNATLTVTGEGGKKAIIKLAGDKGLVPTALHKSLFDKKRATPAKVTVKKQGNLFEIVQIELT